MSKNSLTVLTPDAAPEHSAGLDNINIKALIITLHESVLDSVEVCTHLIGTQVDRKGQLTDIGQDALKLRTALHKAHQRLHTIVEDAVEAKEITQADAEGITAEDPLLPAVDKQLLQA